jgi:ubiquinone/menaquinone biosynthesis C-methylase UbiE
VDYDDTSIARVTRSKQQARASYDRLSRWYDLLAGRSERRFMEMGLHRLAVQEGEAVLEIGFGTGHGIVALAQAVGRSGRVYGIDLSQGMLDITRSRVARAALDNRVHLYLEDAVHLPFEANSMDAVLMSFTLELFDTLEIPVILQECWRVLRPAGRIVVVAMSRRGRVGWMLRLYEWAHRRWPSYLDCRPIHAQEALQGAGFALAEFTLSMMYGLPVEIVLAHRAEEPPSDV